jgi:FMN phosphatase YigB (HAD superfamily)
MQLVDALDRGELPAGTGYADLYTRVRRSLDEAHAEGRLKAEILSAPERFVELEPEIPLALLDQKEAGKKILLITNSDWSYAAPILSFAFDRFLDGGRTWRDLFDVIIVSARKPDFFTVRLPAFELATEDGMLREHSGHLREGGIYVGGDATLVEESFDLSGEEILFVGDHIFADVNVSKSVLRWRTALILRELEDEIATIDAFRDRESRIRAMMNEKKALEGRQAQLRLDLQRLRKDYGPKPSRRESAIGTEVDELREKIADLDAKIAPLAIAATELLNPHWGLLMRAGTDKSHLARQVERYADIYTARVSNFLHHTPFVYLRSPGGSLPHDPP